MLLSIITINYKKSDFTIDCLTTLYRQFKKELEENKFETIIIDNESNESTRMPIINKINKERLKNVRLLANSKNEGFSRACNIGADKAKGKYLLFLNNDTTINDKGILKMVEYMEENADVSILGGQLIAKDGRKQPSTGKFYTLFNTFLLLLGMQKYGVSDKSPNKTSQVDWVKGALLMIKKDVFDKLSGFDEKIFMYTEDMELCYRARLLGYKTYFFPDVSIFHQDYGSSDRTYAVLNIYKGLLYFYKKHRSPLEYKIVKTMLYSKAVIAIAIGYLTGNNYLKTTFRKALQF